MHLLSDRTRVLCRVEDEECAFGVAPSEVPQELVDGFIECFGAAPEFTFCDEHVLVVGSNEDVGLACSVECFPGRRAFVMTVKLDKEVVAYCFLVESGEGARASFHHQG